jgi:hypothetical protein
MASGESGSRLLDDLLGEIVIADLVSPYVCLGLLSRVDGFYFELSDADLHDLRDSTKNRETYIIDSVRFGIRRNRKRVLLRRDEVVAISRLQDVAES